MDTNYYQILDSILHKFISGESSIPVKGREIINGTAIVNGSETSIRQQGYIKVLEEEGLLLHDGQEPISSRYYSLSQRGIHALKTGGTYAYFKKIEEKSELEAKVLKATAESHWLNKVQLWVTIILALGTLLGLLFQYLSYQRENEKNRLEIEKLKIELNKD